MAHLHAKEMAADGSSLEDAHPEVEIDLEDPTDRWRYVCPAGHRNWEPTNYHFWCASCARQSKQGADVEPEFDELRDKQTGKLLEREQVTIEGYRKAHT